MAMAMAMAIEREIHQKSAGQRTRKVVVDGSAVFLIISKREVSDITGEPCYSLDGSRIAPQVDSGIGFLGGGLFLSDTAMPGANIGHEDFRG